MIKKILILSFLGFQLFAIAQEDAWVFFTDKENVAQALLNPTTILTQKSLDRKASQGIGIDERDVPVNENYIMQLKQANGILVLAKSKWFNAVHVRGTEIDINALSTFAFVQSIQFAGSSTSSSKINYIPVNKFDLENNLRINFNYGDTQNQVQMIGIDYLHEQDFTGEGITVAILDSGFPGVNNIDAFFRLRDNNKLLDGYDFVDRNNDVYAYTGNSHGTRVLSTMAAYIENQYVGSAPDAYYYLFRTEDVGSETPVEESYWVEAAERADSLGVDVINTSLGYKDYDNTNYNHLSSDLDGYSTYITRGANIAFEKGLLLVNSAGNSGSSGVNAPADSPFVVSVGSVDSSGNYSSFSSQGSTIQPTQKPNVVARGSSAYIVSETNTVLQNSGTSFSSPILAGGLVCLKQAYPNLSNQELINTMQQSASQYATPDYFLGYGIPNFESALNVLKQKNFNVSDIDIYPNPVQDELNIKTVSMSESIKLVIYSVLGKEVLNMQLNKPLNLINTSQWSKGLYMVVLKSNSDSRLIKVLKD